MTLGTYHHGDLRTALVASGIALLEREGLEALSLRAAARDVGVSHAAPARHFADATSFLAAIAAAGHRELAERLDVADGATPDDTFRAVGQAYVAFALQHPNWYRVVFHPSLADLALTDDELRAASEAAFARLRTHVQRAIVAGVVAPRGIDELALTVWSTVHGICSLVLDRQVAKQGYTDDAAALADLVLTNLYLGLRADG